MEAGVCTFPPGLGARSLLFREGPLFGFGKTAVRIWVMQKIDLGWDDGVGRGDTEVHSSPTRQSKRQEMVSPY